MIIRACKQFAVREEKEASIGSLLQGGPDIVPGKVPHPQPLAAGRRKPASIGRKGRMKKARAQLFWKLPTARRAFDGVQLDIRIGDDGALCSVGPKLRP